ncbi:hypothetical protein SAY86_015529 [Trapa natans]|uniref:N-alpha-acetyltransferase 40 n=1 Tax=Trapa natans TaxID=22666 RepID=A0AAN7QW99_TRANT|nr:hypothetical protein SAY86_015529 [Trapa natans]
MEPKRASSDGGGNNRNKRLKRREILEKKKAVERLIGSAYSVADHLASVPRLRHYRENGLSVYLDSGRGNRLSASVRHYIQNLLKINMEEPYGPEWPEEEKIKRREMVAAEALYVFVHEINIVDENKMSLTLDDGAACEISEREKGPMIGFVHYRFLVEEELPVLYVYELQLEPRIQGKGLGKFLMQLMEFIACKNRMSAILLTVQKSNLPAMSFYTSRLR